MAEVYVTVYCNRCDRSFVGAGETALEARTAALNTMDEHAKKHEDYNPSFHSEIDG